MQAIYYQNISVSLISFCPVCLMVAGKLYKV